ncbi:NADP-dependent 3-hydroxy acid dehydrogenase YdfG [Nonomuraea solani]|uniref:NADP-dependent 3-hydroxy acid dehydrogenase YdfG n=1 Tax=Nonomuraea solani TaxID=1144553 RepID=A0A1H6F0U1_9ACTN|nr:SDR family NAD(P)-dependent oxidoreductase [Nonomuraea solani]SEH02806.1 NADP-dependent 3-hydroxy acid dehydrogenase YdfG [Nonomuraea solani]
MKVAIIGAGPGIGLAVGRRFGAEGFEVSLVARNQDRLTALAGQLAAEGIKAGAQAGDLTDEASLTRALDRIGPVDVLVYNGAGTAKAHTPVLETTRVSAQDAFDGAVLGAITAVRAVLPAMLARGSGTLLFTTGVSAVHPLPFLGNIGVAAAALRNYALSLAEVLGGRGVHVGHVPISAAVLPGSPASPEAVADTHWRLHTERDRTEVVLGDLETIRAAIAAL